MSSRRPLCLIAEIVVFAAALACNSTLDELSGDGSSTTATTTAGGNGATAASTEAENSGTHDKADDYVWDAADVVDILLSGDAIAVRGAGANVTDSTVTITTAGTYRLSGTLADGQIVVTAGNDDRVRLILNGADLRSTTSAPVYVANAGKLILYLAPATVNYVRDGTSYASADTDTDTDGPNAAVFSTCELTIFGEGTLTVQGNCRDGIASKDGLIVAGGTVTVQAVDDGIRGKDYLVVKDGRITVTAGGDGLKSDNDTDATKGYIALAAGVLNVTAGGDAIVAQTDVIVSGGQLTLRSGGGSGRTVAASASAKGLKGLVEVVVEGGTLQVDSADDAVHSNGSITINGGTCVLASADDAIHADTAVVINGGSISVSASYEGIESGSAITVNAGEIHITASDDGVNISGGVDGSAMAGPGGPGGVVATGNGYLSLNGGRLVIDAVGDGIDVNGRVAMTGGEVIVYGPTNNANGALDHGSFTVTDGFLLAIGSAGMAQAPGTASTQYSMMINLKSVQAAGTLVHLQTQQGTEVLTCAPANAYQSIVLSSPALTAGATYDVYLGGRATGTATDGVYQGGTYTAGTKYGSVTLTNVTTTMR